MHFTNSLRNKFVRGAPASLKNYMMTLLNRLDLTMGTTFTQLENLKSMEIIASWYVRKQVTSFNNQRQCECGYTCLLGIPGKREIATALYLFECQSPIGESQSRPL